MDYSLFLAFVCVYAFLYTSLLTFLSENQRRRNGMPEETGISRRHKGNKELSVWSSRKQYEFLEKFLDKYSAGASVARDVRLIVDL